MSLDFELVATVFDANITHNVAGLANIVGLYECLWRPRDCGYTYARDIIPLLKQGIQALKAKPDYYRTLDDKGGWGTYAQFLPWVERLYVACLENPDAKIEVNR